MNNHANMTISLQPSKVFSRFHDYHPPATLSEMLSDGLESCAAFSEEERAALVADCDKLWDDVKCACLSAGGSTAQESSAPAPVVGHVFLILMITCDRILKACFAFCKLFS